MKRTCFSLILGMISFLSSCANAESQNYLFFSPEMIATHIKDYNEEEKAAIEKDMNVIRSVCFPLAKEAQLNKKPLYLATAGGPGSRKTTILERFLALHDHSSSFVYLDPDQRALKFMPHTYYSQSLSALAIAQYDNYALAVKNAYEKWRGASNYITLILMEEAFAQKRDIAHGTTSTGGHIPNFLTNVKNAGYEIVFLLCSCDDAFRQKAVQYRNEEQKFYQSTPEDAVSKGKVFPQRMSAYFLSADTLYLYWSDNLENPERLAAILKGGKLQVFDSSAYHNFVSKYELDREQLSLEGKKIPSWDEQLKVYFQKSQH